MGLGPKDRVNFVTGDIRGLSRGDIPRRRRDAAHIATRPGPP
jgi:hypothetical protein